jgi:hypothetical protein
LLDRINPFWKKEADFRLRKTILTFKSQSASSMVAVMQILKAGVLYFALVFGAGFVLGPIRILWAAPRFGTKMAELMETPILFAVTRVAAWWIVRRLAVPLTLSRRLGMGCIALGLLLVAEFTLVLWLRGLSIREYLASQDPVSGTVYYVMLGVFALMPLLVARR